MLSSAPSPAQRRMWEAQLSACRDNVRLLREEAAEMEALADAAEDANATAGNGGGLEGGRVVCCGCWGGGGVRWSWDSDRGVCLLRRWGEGTVY